MKSMKLIYFVICCFTVSCDIKLYASKKEKCEWELPKPQNLLICLCHCGVIEAGALVYDRFTMLDGPDVDRAEEACRTVGGWLKTKQIKIDHEKATYYRMELIGPKNIIKRYSKTKEDETKHFILLGYSDEHVVNQQKK